MNNLRANLPELPPNIAKLPVSDRGYPVPWFVQWLVEDHNQVHPFDPKAEGLINRSIYRPAKSYDEPGAWPEFRMIDPGKVLAAIELGLCWVCGEPRVNEMVFVIGPMCAVNRVSGEPPSHLVCAEFSARACPFLTMPKLVRREDELTQHSVAHAGAIMRNPGVTMLWTCRKYAVEDGLFMMGAPTGVVSYKEGRLATKEEVLESIRAGLPKLRESAARDFSEKELERCVRRALADLGLVGETV